MLRPLRYVFYRVHSWRSGVSSDHVPAFTTIFTLAVLATLAASAGSLAWEVVTGHPSWLVPKEESAGPRGALVWLLAAVLQYLVWVRNEKYRDFASEFSGMSAGARTLGTIAIWATVTALIAANIVLAWVIQSRI